MRTLEVVFLAWLPIECAGPKTAGAALRQRRKRRGPSFCGMTGQGIMLPVVFLFMGTTLVYPALGLRLEVSPTKIETGVTQNVVLECRNTNVTTHITIIKIVKLTQSGDQTLAEIFGTNNTAHSDTGIPVTGQIGPSLGQDYLTIGWPVAEAETYGTYRCDMMGFDIYYSPVVESSDVLAVIEHVPTLYDIIQQLQEERQKGESEIAAFKLEMRGEINQTVAFLESKHSQMMNQFNSKIDRETSDLEDLIDSEHWPQGSYMLHKARSGCPTDTLAIDWTWRIYTQDTELYSNHDSVSSNSHFDSDTVTTSGNNHIVYLNNCAVKSRTIGQQWPKGSYCFYKYKVGTAINCPEGFHEGRIYTHQEDDGHSAPNKWSIPYCCRSDGPVSTEIYLPTSQPFYLHRYKGACQKVAHMHVQEEYIKLTTETTHNQDGYSNSYHPDSSLNPLVIHFCYYYK